MILETFIGISAAVAFVWTLKNWKPFPFIITLGLITGIILTFLQVRTAQFQGIHFYMGFVALAFIYGIVVKEKDLKARIIICLMSASLFTYWLWVVNHWHGNEILAPILALVIGAAGISTKAKLRYEAGFLLIFAADAVALIIEHVLKAP